MHRTITVHRFVAALEDACAQLLEGHAVNRIVGPTITAERVKAWCAKHRSSPDGGQKPGHTCQSATCIRMKKSANNELTTGEKHTQSDRRCRQGRPVPGTSPIAPTSNQGLAVNLCCDSHHATMAPMGTRTNNIVMLTARVSLSCSWDWRLVLRHEILLGAWHAVTVSPAVDHW
jgi:hypothetical protein